MKKLITTFFLLFALMGLSRTSDAITIAIANDPNGVFEGTSTGINPATGQDTSEFNLNNAYQSVFGFPSANVLPQRSIWGETPTLMTFGFGARGDNVKVDTFQEFEFDIFGNYWTLESKLTFNPATAIFVDPNDHIIWDGTLKHTGKLSTNDSPHEGDDLVGANLGFSIDLSAGDKTDALFGQLTHAFDFETGQHPSIGHQDAVLGIMQGRVTGPNLLIDEIEGSYTGLMVGMHLDGREPVVPEPATLILLGGGLAAMLYRQKNRKV